MRVRVDRSSTVPSGCLLYEHCRQADIFVFTFNPQDITPHGACELGKAMTIQVTSWVERAAGRGGAWYPVDIVVRRASGMPHGTLLWVHEEATLVQYWFDRTLISRKGAIAFARALTRSQVGWVQAGNAPALRAVAG